jgi:hypothetical protein
MMDNAEARQLPTANEENTLDLEVDSSMRTRSALPQDIRNCKQTMPTALGFLSQFPDCRK